MVNCDETNSLWNEMTFDRNTFFAQEDWRDTAQKHYDENKDIVD